MPDEIKIIEPSPEKLKAMEQLMDMIEQNKFVWLTSDEQIQGLVAFIGYRAQYALYEITLKTKPDLRWEDFVLFVRSNTQVRSAVQAVAIHATDHFDMSVLDFAIPEDALEYIDDNDGELIYSSKIFESWIGRGMLEMLLIRAEMEYFKRLRTENPHYFWDTYRQELEHNQEMWKQFSRTFQHGLRQIDFMESWFCEDIPETEFLRCP